MKCKAILFDLDGTLLPMDTEFFTKSYFKLLYAKLAGHHLDPAHFGEYMWQGVKAMVKNDGTRTNEEAFWAEFTRLYGIEKSLIEPDCTDFYGNEFHQARVFTRENPQAAEAVRIAHEKAPIVALATNPLFPMVGQRTRMSWVGLSPEDFDLVTCFEEERCCKPNPLYYHAVCQKLGVKPEECLLIGNDENEDMLAGTQAGLNCYLVTDCMISDPSHPWEGPKGTFAEMVEMLKKL